MLEEMGRLTKTMRAQLDEAFDALEVAKKASNLRCMESLHEAITAMKGLVRLAEQNLIVSKEAAIKDDMKTLNYSHATVRVAAAKMRELSIEVRTACASGTRTTEEGEGGLEILSESKALIGPTYGLDGGPQSNEPLTPAGSDPTEPQFSGPIWGDHPASFDIPTFDEPVSASPAL